VRGMTSMFTYATVFNQCLSTWPSKVAGNNPATRNMFSGSACSITDTDGDTWCQSDGSCIASFELPSGCTAPISLLVASIQLINNFIDPVVLPGGCTAPIDLLEASCQSIQSASPSSSPTANPTSSPTSSPSSSPTSSPTANPTASPTSNPTSSPSSGPSSGPTSSPTANPTASPVPTDTPTTTESVNCTPTPNVCFKGCNKKKRGCNWVGMKPGKPWKKNGKGMRCSLMAENMGGSAEDFCPNECLKECNS